MRTAVVGATAWGATLAVVLARQGREVRLLTRSPAEAARLAADRTSPRLPAGVVFPRGLEVTADPRHALTGAALAVIAVPSESMQANAAALAGSVPDRCLVISATKGIQIGTGLRMTELIRRELPAIRPSDVGALSGPNLAPEIAQGKLASAVVAFEDEDRARAAQEALNSDVFRVYRSDDVRGVELGGALKNIVAIGAGIIDGFSLGDNAKAAFVTRGLHEITRLGVALGARPETFAGLSGMGDLVATCYSGLSRNRRVGQELAQGRSLTEVLATLKQTAEGVPTTRAAVRMARGLGVEMPITELTARVLFDGLPAAEAVRLLMQRAPAPEARL